MKESVYIHRIREGHSVIGAMLFTGVCVFGFFDNILLYFKPAYLGDSILPLKIEIWYCIHPPGGSVSQDTSRLFSENPFTITPSIAIFSVCQSMSQLWLKQKSRSFEVIYNLLL